MKSLEGFIEYYETVNKDGSPEVSIRLAEKAYRDYRISYFAGQIVPECYREYMDDAVPRVALQRAVALVDALEAREANKKTHGLRRLGVESISRLLAG